MPLEKIAYIKEVLQFAYNDKKAQNQHKGNYAIVSGKYGVLCTWYSLDEGTGHCQLITSEHEYIPTNNYICTLTSGCIIKEEKEEDSQLHVGFVSTALSLSKEFYIDKQCLNSILNCTFLINLICWMKINPKRQNVGYKLISSY